MKIRFASRHAESKDLCTFISSDGSRGILQSLASQARESAQGECIGFRLLESIRERIDSLRSEWRGARQLLKADFVTHDDRVPAKFRIVVIRKVSPVVRSTTFFSREG